MVDDDKGNILNAKSQFEYKNPIVDLDDIQREYSEWSLKKCSVDNIKYDQNKELKRYYHIDTNREDQVYSNSNSDDGNKNDDDTFHDATQVISLIDDTNDDNNDTRKTINNESLQLVGEWKGTTEMMYEDEGILYVNHLLPDPLDHLDNISMLDPYSNKQWNQPNQHDCSKQDLYGPLIHVYNRMTYYGEQPLRLHIINYCSDSIKNSTYDNMRIYIYCYGEQRLLFDTVISNKQNPDPLKRAHSPQGMLLCPNPDPLKRTYSPQGILLLIDPTRCCVINKKDGECPDLEVKLYH